MDSTVVSATDVFGALASAPPVILLALSGKICHQINYVSVSRVIYVWCIKKAIERSLASFHPLKCGLEKTR